MNSDELKDHLETLHTYATSRRAKKTAYSVAIFGAAVGLFSLLVVTRGAVDAIVYAFLFLFCATFFPVWIGLMGNALPGNKTIGKLHIILGAMAFNHHYLVERDDKYEWRPGNRGEVYIDGKLRKIKGGLNNYSVLGWRPFGVLRYKENKTWVQQRVDEKAKKERGVATTDGGEHAQEIAGWRVKAPPIVSGVSGTWLLDLKRIYSRGVKKIGDIGLIETAEEVIERGEVDEKRLSGWRPYIETVTGIVLGGAMAAVYMGLSG